MRIGAAIGIANIIAFYTYLKALEFGSIILVTSLTGMSMVVAIGISVLIFKEKLSNLKLVAVVMSVIGAILTKIYV